ncbi:hypothetical protein C900_02792 [Fulvivirga imtechensis AK7]|uniref:CcmD family protein n=1 Tax=Fulvivirga imtechensis AK7 TaxID=1237149 RepID=L8JR48_9BACT|nr:hypothetical protein [Fulvivirga imtechensis]ELR71451.1 hypothetical protein C900_02792 [Fulvivirga imtechensis AK7]
MKRLTIISAFILSSLFVQAQDKIKIEESDYGNEQVEMADEFRKEGKIYVLTGVICLILGGIIAYLLVIDKKVSRLEKEIKKP